MFQLMERDNIFSRFRHEQINYDDYGDGFTDINTWFYSSNKKIACGAEKSIVTIKNKNQEQKSILKIESKKSRVKIKSKTQE